MQKRLQRIVLQRFHSFSVVKYAKKGDSERALDITSELMIGGDSSLFYQASGWSNVYNYLSPENAYPNLGRFLTNTRTRKSIHVGNTTFGDNHVYTHLSRDMMVCKNYRFSFC